MSETITPDVPANENIDYEEAIKQMFAEINQANEKMERDQEEIDRLKAETSQIISMIESCLKLCGNSYMQLSSKFYS